MVYGFVVFIMVLWSHDNVVWVTVLSIYGSYPELEKPKVQRRYNR